MENNFARSFEICWIARWKLRMVELSLYTACTCGKKKYIWKGTCPDITFCVNIFKSGKVNCIRWRREENEKRRSSRILHTHIYEARKMTKNPGLVFIILSMKYTSAYYWTFRFVFFNCQSQNKPNFISRNDFFRVFRYRYLRRKFILRAAIAREKYNNKTEEFII